MKNYLLTVFVSNGSAVSYNLGWSESIDTPMTQTLRMLGNWHNRGTQVNQWAYESHGEFLNYATHERALLSVVVTD